MKNGSVNWFTVLLTWLVRILFWPVSIWIIILCIQRGYSLLVMHVIFSTMGCGLLLVEATLAVSGDAVLSASVSRSGRITIHWVLNLLGIVMLVIGFVTVEIHKIRGGAGHFTSDHGILGLTAYLAGFVVALFAIPTVCTKLLCNGVSLACFKFVHIFAGIIALILLWAGQITGLYTNWWRGSDIMTTTSVVGFTAGGFFLIIKPCALTLSRVFTRSS